MNEYLLSQLRTARNVLETASSEMKALIEKAKQDDIYTSLQAAATLAEGEIERLTESIHDEAMHQYSVDQKKHPHPKVEIKAFKTFKVDDLKTVDTWARLTFPAALDVNLKKVEKFAKEFGEVPGATLGEELRVQIAKEL